MEIKAAASQLRDILNQHGRTLLKDPRRLEQLLIVRLGGKTAEASALAKALKEGIPRELLRPFTGLFGATVLTPLANRLQANCGLGKDLARWTVAVWAHVLDVFPAPQSLQNRGAAQSASPARAPGAKPAPSPRAVHPGWKPRMLPIGGVVALAFCIGVAAVPIGRAVIARRANRMTALREEADEAFRGNDFPTAFKLCMGLARQGDADAQDWLGQMYQGGYGVSQDQAVASEWYRKAREQWRKAAEQGDPDAQFNLGLVYLFGKGVPPDGKQAIRWLNQGFNQAAEQYRKAPDSGSAEELAHLSAIYVMGFLAPKDEMKAAEFSRMAVDRWTRAAAQGDAHAQNHLGDVLSGEMLTGLPKDPVQAAQWYRKAAGQENPYAQGKLGTMYETGEGVAQDKAQALEWYRKAAALGSTVAREDLARLNAAPPPEVAESGTSPGRSAADASASPPPASSRKREFARNKGGTETSAVPPESRAPSSEVANAPKTEKLENDRSNPNNSAVALVDLMANCSRQAKRLELITQDRAKGLTEAQALAIHDIPMAMENMVFMVYLGVSADFIQKDEKEWYRTCFEEGKKSGTAKPGFITYQTMEKLKTSANAGNLLAQEELGAIYFAGQGGVTQDYKEALKWFDMAYDQVDKETHQRKSVIAPLYLARMYENGWGVGRDAEYSYDYFTQLILNPKTPAELRKAIAPERELVGKQARAEEDANALDANGNRTGGYGNSTDAKYMEVMTALVTAAVVASLVADSAESNCDKSSGSSSAGCHNHKRFVCHADDAVSHLFGFEPGCGWTANPFE